MQQNQCLLPLLSAGMAALKLITLRSMPLSRISSSNVIACSDCPRFSHAVMDSLKIIILAVWVVSRILSSGDAASATAFPSRNLTLPH